MTRRAERCGRNLPRNVARLITTLILGTLLVPIPGRAQQEKAKKLPGLDKITSGPSQQAFSGIVSSVDLKRKILNVGTVQGGVTEIFPIKREVHVVTADGDRLKLSSLTPGTNVIIYYEQRADRRNVKQIVILAGEPKAAKKKTPSS
jgi:hypothetical protein